MDFSQLSDRDLYRQCPLVGAVVLKYRNQFLGMLPEVARRRLYMKYGMHSVQEFASRLAGISHEVTDKVLRLNEKLSDAPVLQKRLQSGEIGWSKLDAVSSLVNHKNESFWAEKLTTLSKPALETYVRELKLQSVNHEAEFSPGGENKAENFQQNSLHPDDRETMSFSIHRRTAARIRVFKQQLEKRLKKPLTLEQVMEEFLRIAQESSARSEKSQDVVKRAHQHKKTSANVPQKCVNRHIPVDVRREIWQRYRGVCAFPHCNQAGKILHHTERFSLHRCHDPDTIVPLCIPHERIAHSSLIGNEHLQPNKWRILEQPDRQHPKYLVDRMVQKYRSSV